MAGLPAWIPRVDSLSRMLNCLLLAGPLRVMQVFLERDLWRMRGLATDRSQFPSYVRLTAWF